MEAEFPLVSIIVPVYKTKEYMRECIQSILSQTYSNLEVILVDDGSPDECPAICDTFAEQDSRVRVIHKENQGSSLARATGIQSALGSYIMFVDSDDWIDGEAVEVSVAKALQDQADCVLFGYTREYQGKSIDTLLFEDDFTYDRVEAEAKVHRRIVGVVNEELREPQRIDSISSIWGKLYLTDIAKIGRIVSERVVGTSEDTIFNLYALDNCRISYINRCFYHYRKTNVSSITSQYKPDLADKWDVMYGVIQEYIDCSGRVEDYRLPFLNRVACGMIGLGLNEIGGLDSLWKKSKRLKRILNKPLYREAFAQLDTRYCSKKWKAFFFLCKRKTTLLLAILLQIMNVLRAQMAS